MPFRCALPGAFCSVIMGRILQESAEGVKGSSGFTSRGVAAVLDPHKTVIGGGIFPYWNLASQEAQVVRQRPSV